MQQQELITLIDKIHKETNESLANKQFDIYIGCFADSLQYKRLNGVIIGKKELVNSIKSYFNRIRSFSSRYDRKNFKILADDRIAETMIQYSKVGIRLFIFFTKNWTIEREGIYEWQKFNDTWKIINVEVTSEKVF